MLSTVFVGWIIYVSGVGIVHGTEAKLAFACWGFIFIYGGLLYSFSYSRAEDQRISYTEELNDIFMRAIRA